MASVVAGGLFNAVAFAGAGYLFSRLNHGGYEKEIRRHNKAMETLARYKEKWYKRTVKRRNREATLRQELADADKDISRTNRALDDLRKIRAEMTEDAEPTIDDFYTPSDEIQEFQHVATAIIGLGTGGVVGYLKKNLI